MTKRKFGTMAAGPATVTRAVIPEAEFQEIVKDAQGGNLRETTLHDLENDQNRARAKRKEAVRVGNVMEAASASSREVAIARMVMPYALSGVRSRPGQKLGGKTTGEIRCKSGEETKTKVHALATEFLGKKKPREVSGIISRRLSISRQKILDHLRDHPSGHWEKKVK